MKRFVLLLLAFTMLFVMASAEESFVEEDFAVAASFDDEFFAEETLIGDEFEAEQPEVEDEIEDRSVFLFEDEKVNSATLAEWQKWEIKDLQATAKKNKVTLTWSVTKPNPSAQPSGQGGTPVTKKELKSQKGVKVFVYQVDANTGVATQVKKPLASTKNKVAVSVKNPGTYYYFVRLEKVDKKSAAEDLGIASNKAKITVSDIKNAKAISKVKVFADVYAAASEQPSEQTSVQPVTVVIVYADVYTKEADTKYTVTAQQKGGSVFTGTYTLDPEEKNEIFANGVVRVPLLLVDWKDNKAPTFEANGKKITVSVQSSVMKKAKKGSATPKAITVKTQPTVSAEQVDATTITVKWHDQAAAAGYAKPTTYTIQIGKKKFPVKVDDKQLVTGMGGYYEYTVTGYPANTKKKAQTLKITVKSDAKGAKKSKAYKLAFQPASLGAIMNLTVFPDNDGSYKVIWDSMATVKAYEVYATDSAHSKEVYAEGVKAENPSEQSGQPAVTSYSATFKAEDLKDMTKGQWLSFTVKAVDGTKVLGRAVTRAYNFNFDPSAEPSEEPTNQKN